MRFSKNEKTYITNQLNIKTPAIQKELNDWINLEIKNFGLEVGDFIKKVQDHIDVTNSMKPFGKDFVVIKSLRLKTQKTWLKSIQKK